MKNAPKGDSGRVSPVLVVLGVLALGLGLVCGLYMSLIGARP